MLCVFQTHRFGGAVPPCRGWGLLKLLLLLLCSFFFIKGPEKGLAWPCDMSCALALCVYVCACLWAVCVCVCVLCIQTPSVWWPDTVWESVRRRRIHTQHKGSIMSPHSEKEKGGGWGDNRGLSISEGGAMVSLPLTSPSSLLPAPPQTNMCQQKLSTEKIPFEENRHVSKHLMPWIVTCQTQGCI